MDVYRQKYTKMAYEFWTLQQQDKTKEEIEYDNLIKQLETMLVEYRDQIEKLENENDKLQAQIGDAASTIAEYRQLEEEERNLRELKEDIAKYRKQ